MVKGMEMVMKKKRKRRRVVLIWSAAMQLYRVIGTFPLNLLDNI